MIHRTKNRQAIAAYWLLALIWLCCGAALAQVVEIQPRIVRPGQTEQLTLRGKNLDQSLRIISSVTDLPVTVESATAEQAVVRLNLPADCPLGPMAIWTATSSTVSEPWLIMVDDLPVLSRDANNVSRQSAQTIATQAAIAGVSRGAVSDFYRFHVQAGQRLAFEIHTQALHSAMDPLVRLSAADGTLLKSVDDDGAGPDLRFSHRFEQAGDYLLEVVDSRYAAGGAYHLRIGDFPVLSHARPGAIQRGQSATIHFATQDGMAAQSQKGFIAADNRSPQSLFATRNVGGSSSSWLPIHLSDLPIHNVDQSLVAIPSTNSEAQTSAASATAENSTELTSVAQTPAPGTLSIPACISGCLTTAKQVDRVQLNGAKDQTVRFLSKTRSLGSPAQLKMWLTDSAGKTVAETAVAKDDEWSFDYKFPEDNQYTLHASDLIQRGGDQFRYVIELQPVPGFTLSWKGDAKTSQQIQLDPTRGCAAMDIAVQRAGYDGEIQLELVGVPSTAADAGLRLLQPIIPASVNQFRIYLVATHLWSADKLVAIGLRGRAVSQPEMTAELSSLALERLKKPYAPYPQPLVSGRLAVGGAPSSDALFSLNKDAPLRLAKYITDQPSTLTLSRLNADFKGNVTILPDRLPSDWKAQFKQNGDNFETTLSLPASSWTNENSQIEVLLYGEHQGRGLLESVQMPVQWYDPIAVKIQLPRHVIAGSTLPVAVSVERSIAAQPIIIRWPSLPSGWQISDCEIAADQSTGECRMTVANNAQPGATELAYTLTSKFSDKEFSWVATAPSIELLSAPARIEIFPSELQLTNVKDKRQVVVTGFDAENHPSDWTHLAQLTSSQPSVASIENGGVVRARSNGVAELRAQVGSAELSIPAKVSGCDLPVKTQFESEVLVALSKQGCNSGACHGSPSGKGMFRLSLRAFDPALDELTLIREEFGRRVNVVEPDQSLLLLKPLMRIFHGGGKQINQEDIAYQVLVDWIRQGAQADPPDTARCHRIEVFPFEQRTLPVSGGSQQLAVVAHFADGKVRDVTELVVYESSNQQVASVNATGLVQASGRGEAVILVRYLEHIESVRFTCLDENPQFQWQADQPHNDLDRLVDEKLRRMQYLPSPLCSDSEFLRRVYLDLIGLLPSIDQTRSFLGDSALDKRQRVINDLLQRPEFAKFWALKWGDLLKLTSKQVGPDGVYKYQRWIEEAIAGDMPYDQFARQLITASGSTLANPPSNFYRTATDMNDCVEMVSQIFLGARVQCAKCHNHPFERWTQDNYYGMAAFFNRVGRRETLRPGEMFVYSNASGEVVQPRTGKPMRPWLPGQGDLDLPSDQDRRVAFAAWLTAEGNPYFARIGANRIWSQLFSRGIIDPVDDFRDSNPPANEPLLDALATQFQQSNYSMKQLLRTILQSRTYQASAQASEANRTDDRYFSHQQPRLLKAEQLLDAINHLTGISPALGSLPAEIKATQLPAPDLVNVDFLKTFGQPERSTVCACERVSDSNLGMAIELLNGPLIHERLRATNNRFRQAIAAGSSAEHVLDELYLASYCRLPSDAERQTALEHLKRNQDLASGFEDICWAIMNTDEFLFQH